MKTRIKLIDLLPLLALLLLWVNTSGVLKVEAGRTGKISGYILHATSRRPIENAAVTLFSATDLSMVAGTITNSDGGFAISMLTTGNYLLEISNPGYEKKEIDGLSVQSVQPKIDVGEVLLNPDVETGKKNNCKKVKSIKQQN